MIDYELESLFEQDSVNKQLVIELSGGTTLTNADIVSESLKLQESICSEQNLTFGSCEASVISFQTVCLEDLVGQTMNVSIILNGNTEKPFVLGEYKVASCKLSDDRKRRNVTAYDKIYDFINRDVIEWYNQLFPTAETTKTVKQVRDSFFNYFGIEQETTTLVNDSVVISKTISADTLSGKDVIKCILEINGCFGHIGRDGKFHYITISIDEMIYPDYDLFPDYDTFPSGQSMEFIQNTYKTIRFEEYNVKSIDCVAMREQSTGEPTVVGNPGNAYYIEDNFLLYGKNSTELTTIGQNLLPLMSGIVYTPLALTKRANPCCEVGDNIGVTLVGGQHLTTIVMKREISGIQAMFDVLGATGDEELPQIKSNVQTEITQLKSRQTQIETSVDGISVDISSIERNIDSIEDEQSTMQTQISANAESISTEVTRATTAEGNLSSRITQTADSISAEVTRATGAEDNLSSRITQTADDITAEITRATNAEGALSTRIQANADGLSTKVSKNNIISEINQSAESVDINADRINLNGVVTANDYFKINTDGSMEAVNGKFSGTIQGSGIVSQKVEHQGDGTFTATQTINDGFIYSDYDYDAGEPIGQFNWHKFVGLGDGHIYLSKSERHYNSGLDINPDSITMVQNERVISNTYVHGDAAVLDIGDTRENNARLVVFGYISSSGNYNCGGGISVAQGYMDWLYGGVNKLSIYANTNDNNAYIYSRINELYIYAQGGGVGIKKDGGGWQNLYAVIQNVSSRLVKDNIKYLTDEDGQKILDLKPVYYDYADWYSDQKNQLGLIAEEVLEVFPELVTIPDGYDENAIDKEKGTDNKVPSLNYTGFIAPIIKLCQSQQKEIDELKATISDLAERISKLENKEDK